jgi:hypothetical protein
MKIILTNDGMIGLNIDGKVIWCNNQAEALDIMWSVFGKRNTFTKQNIAADLAYGIDHCAKTHDNIIEFGALGSFMYTTTEPEYEF